MISGFIENILIKIINGITFIIRRLTKIIEAKNGK